MDLVCAMQELEIEDYHITLDEAKKKYRKLMRQYHPDNATNYKLKEEYEEKTKIINDAFDVVKAAYEPNKDGKAQMGPNGTGPKIKVNVDSGYGAYSTEEEYKEAAARYARQKEEERRRAAEAEAARDHSHDKFSFKESIFIMWGTKLLSRTIVFGIIDLWFVIILLNLKDFSTSGLKNAGMEMAAVMLVLTVMLALGKLFVKVAWWTFNALIPFVVTFFAIFVLRVAWALLFDGLLANASAMVLDYVMLCIVLIPELLINFRRLRVYICCNPYPPERKVAKAYVYELIFACVAIFEMPLLTMILGAMG